MMKKSNGINRDGDSNMQSQFVEKTSGIFEQNPGPQLIKKFYIKVKEVQSRVESKDYASNVMYCFYCTFKHKGRLRT